MGIYSCLEGRNNDIISSALSLYSKEGEKILDVTFGQGAFWHKIDLTKYIVIGSDILTREEAERIHKKFSDVTFFWETDFRCLPFSNNSFDHVFFDPPYVHNPGKKFGSKTYRNLETTKGFYHKDIMDLYRLGMREAKRVLRTQGFLYVKCQDEISASKQCWSHIEIFNVAIQELGMYPKDLFVLKQKGQPKIQHKNQKHARKNHSYLWVFIKSPKLIL